MLKTQKTELSESERDCQTGWLNSILRIIKPSLIFLLHIQKFVSTMQTKLLKTKNSIVPPVAECVGVVVDTSRICVTCYPTNPVALPCVTQVIYCTIKKSYNIY